MNNIVSFPIDGTLPQPRVIPSKTSFQVQSGTVLPETPALFKFNSATGKMTACTLASDMPSHVLIVGSKNGDSATFQILGSGFATVKTSGTVAAGDVVYTAAGGAVSTLSASAGTYYAVGMVVTAGTDNTAEIVTCVPRKTVVAEA